MNRKLKDEDNKKKTVVPPKIELVNDKIRTPRGEKYLPIIVKVIEMLLQIPAGSDKKAKVPIGPEWIDGNAAARMSFRTGVLRAGRQTRKDGRQSLSTSEQNGFFYTSKIEEFDKEAVEDWLRRKKKA